MLAKEQARARRVTSALLIGGEPTLFPDRIAAFVECMPYVTISSNGLRALPRQGFENVAVALTLFGGEGRDDELRAIKPGGGRFEGLFDEVLRNYRGDDRATFVFAVDPANAGLIGPTVERIADNGNLVTLNYYSPYGSGQPLSAGQNEVLDTLLIVRDRFPEVVVNTAYSIETLVTGKTHWARFGYEVCPSVSVDHPDHTDRLRNGEPVLPGFNSYAADGQTLNFCCASGRCDECRDGQAIYSWLILSMKQFLDSPASLELWIATVESYWRQFKWSPYHRSQSDRL